MRSILSSRTLSYCFVPLFAALCSLATLNHAQAQFKNDGAQLGANIYEIVDWSSTLMFTDLMHEAREWIPQTNSIFDTGETLNLRPSDGYPASLLSGHWASTGLKTGSGGFYPAGNYTLLYDGEGNVGVRHDAITYHTEPGLIRFRVDNPSGSGILLTIYETNPANPVRNIRVVLPGFEDSYETQYFHPKFIESLQPFSVLRFMDTQHTNWSAVETWDHRTKYENYTQQGPYGASIEMMIDLANEVGADPWFCIPHRANDQFIQNFAAMVRDRLNPDLKVYIELSNEIWNSFFGQAQYFEGIGKSRYPEVTPFEARLRAQSDRSVEMFDIFEQVFGGTERVVRVIGSFHVGTWASQTLLAWNNTYQKTDAIATAPYFGHALGNPNAGHNTPNQSLDYVFSFLATDMAAQRNQSLSQKAIADSFGVRLITYEGGQHLAAGGEWQENSAVTQLFTTANRDPRMRQLYRDYHRGWYEDIGDLFVSYSLTGPLYNKYGSWAMIEKYTRPFSEAPKYMGLLDFYNEISVGPDILSFSATPSSIAPGASTTLSWTVADAASVSIAPGIGTVAANGSTSVSPSTTTTYTITASNAEGTKTSSTVVTVNANPAASIDSFTATPSSIAPGGSSVLAWSVSNATSVSISPGVGTFTQSIGNATVTPAATTAYTITATGPGGSNSTSLTVTVSEPSAAPKVNTFSATPASIDLGESSILSWTTENATSVNITPDVGTVNPNGSVTVTPTVSTAYSIVATGPGGEVTANTTIVVFQPDSAKVLSFTANPSSIVAGQSSVLSWQTENATTLDISPGVGTVAGASGSVNVTPANNTSYTLVATGPGGQHSATATVNVTPQQVAPTITAQPKSTTVVIGRTTTFTVTASGSGPLQYQWTKNGDSIPGAITAAYTIPPASESDDASQYTVVVSNSAGSVTSQPATLSVSLTSPRVETGLQVLYLFDEGQGDVVRDQSNVGVPMDLRIYNPGAVQWNNKHLSIHSSTIVRTENQAWQVFNALQATNELTLEAWVQPANQTQTGAARIASLSNDVWSRSAMLAQDATAYEARVRTTATHQQGTALMTSSGGVNGGIQHLMITRSQNGATTFYLDGVQTAVTDLPGDFSGWYTAQPFVIANEASQDRPWLGDLHLVAIYDRALTNSEVSQNFSAGPDPSSAPPVGGGGPDTTVAIGASKDVTLFQDSWGGIASGSGAYIYTGTVPSGERERALVAFDVAKSIPHGATILDATLRMNVSTGRASTGTQTVSLIRAAADWGEGPSDAGNYPYGTTAQKGDATWIHTFSRNRRWNNPGGDMHGTFSSSTSVAGLGTYEWSGADLVADIQEWVDGDVPNFGWFIIGNESIPDTAKYFDSTQHPNPGNQPLLVVRYSTAARTNTGQISTVDVSAAADATIYQDPKLSNGAGPELASGTENNGESRRTLLKFDLAKTVPSNAEITNVELVLQSTDPEQSGMQAFDLYPVTKAWKEGTASSLVQVQPVKASNKEVTWTNTGEAGPWKNAGGDYQPYVRATVNVSGSGEYIWSSAGMIEDIKAWLQGADSNHGWLLIGREGIATTKKLFGSSENPNPSMRPILRVTYTNSRTTRDTDGTSSTESNILHAELEGDSGTAAATIGAATGTTGVKLDGRVVIDPEGTAYEPSVPSMPHETGIYRAYLDSLLAVRLRANDTIATDTLWADVAGASEDAYLVSWQYASPEVKNDIWVIVEPIGFWPEEGVVSVSVGATTASGNEFATAATSFHITPEVTPGIDAYMAKSTLTIEETSEVPAAEQGVGKVYSVQPERVFAKARQLLLPVPADLDPSRVRPLYYKTTGDDPGWFLGTKVEGWMASPNSRLVKRGGQYYLELYVHHAGVVQLGVL